MLTHHNDIYIDEFEFENFKYIRITNEKGEIIGCRKRNNITFYEEKIEYDEFIEYKLKKNKITKKISLEKNKPIHL